MEKLKNGHYQAVDINIRENEAWDMSFLGCFQTYLLECYPHPTNSESPHPVTQDHLIE